FGSERSLLDLLGSLDPARVRPRLVLVRPGPLAAAARESGVPVELFPWLEGPFRSHDPRALLAAVRLSRWLRREGVRLVEL
ncbi:hypothetical protein ABTK00_21915, partial [Acinetobacter baumannii]